MDNGRPCLIIGLRGRITIKRKLLSLLWFSGHPIFLSILFLHLSLDRQLCLSYRFYIRFSRLLRPPFPLPSVPFSLCLLPPPLFRSFQGNIMPFSSIHSIPVSASFHKLNIYLAYNHYLPSSFFPFRSVGYTNSLPGTFVIITLYLELWLN